MPELSIYVLYAAFLVVLTTAATIVAVTAVPVEKRWLVVVIGVWFAALAFMTVRPGSGLGVRINLVPIIVDGPGSAFDGILNVFVFVPLGILLALLALRALPALGIALALSLSIEVTQYATNLGRTADVNDLITNVAGAGIGWLLVAGIQSSRRANAPTPSDADSAD